MVNPLSNDKIPSALSQRSSNADQKSVKQSQSQEQKTQPGDSVATQTKGVEDTLELSDSGRIFSQTADRTVRSAGEVATPGEAIALATRIREQLEQAGPQSLTIHRDIRADQLANLLHTAPA